MIFHADKTTPKDGRIFVFGSNLAGRHGAGAALEARLRYGALLGKGEGLVGNSYAIPTKTANFECLSLEEVRSHVETFVLFTLENPDMTFFVTRVGCGLAGNKDEDVAPMFRGAINCSFPENWRSYLAEEALKNDWPSENEIRAALELRMNRYNMYNIRQ